MRASIASWRVALRIARREAARAKGRSALVLVMLAIPVLGLAFAAVSWDMFTLTPDERADRAMGTADARITWPFAGPLRQDASGDVTFTMPGTTPAGPDLGDAAQVQTALAGKLPAGTRMLPIRRGEIAMHTAGGLGQITTIALDATDPLARGFVSVVSGRAPQSATEIALTRQALTRTGASIGGTVAFRDDQRAYTVVGQVEFGSSLAQFALISPDSPAAAHLGDPGFLVDTPQPVTWADVQALNNHGIVVVSRAVLRDPPSAADLGLPYGLDPGVDPQLSLGGVVLGFSILEIILLAGSAFAVGARRRRRQLALIAASGGEPRHIRRIVLGDGIVLGTAGAVVGLLVGVPTALLARPLVEEYVWHARAGGYRFFPTALAGIVALAVVTGVLAATVPAFVTARQDVVESLAGRRGITRSRKRWLALGLAMTAIGTAAVAYGASTISINVLTVGFIVGELGLVLCTPTLVGLIARLGGRLPVPLRISLRDTGRNRAAAAPAISAVMAVVASAVALGLYEDSARAMSMAAYWPDLPEGTVAVYIGGSEPDSSATNRARVLEVVNEVLPGAQVLDLPVVGCRDVDPDTGAGLDPDHTGMTNCEVEAQMPAERACPYLRMLNSGPLSIADMRAAARDRRCDNAFHDVSGGFRMGGPPIDDGTSVAALTGASEEDAAWAAAVLRGGGVVVRDARYIVDGRVTFAVADRQGGALDPVTATHISFPAYLLKTGVPAGGPILSPQAAAQAKLHTISSGLIVVPERPPTQEQEDALNLRLEALGTSAIVERAPDPEEDPRLLLLTVAAALIAVGATAVATGLAAADRRADLSTLAAIGASPRIRRLLSLSQSGLIGGVGAVLGAAAGLGAAIAILVALNQRYDAMWPMPAVMPIMVPWSILAIAVLGVPAVAMLGAGAFTRSSLPIERRRS
jgi:putative ABC transport system permease protein